MQPFNPLTVFNNIPTVSPELAQMVVAPIIGKAMPRTLKMGTNQAGRTFVLADGGNAKQLGRSIIDLVILKVLADDTGEMRVSRNWWVKGYSPENPTAPDCFSADGKHPHSTAQNTPVLVDRANPAISRKVAVCSECPNNNPAQGSGMSKCAKRPTVIAVTPDLSPNGLVMISVSPQSAFGGKNEQPVSLDSPMLAIGAAWSLAGYLRFISGSGHNLAMFNSRLFLLSDQTTGTPMIRFGFGFEPPAATNQEAVVRLLQSDEYKAFDAQVLEFVNGAMIDDETPPTVATPVATPIAPVTTAAPPPVAPVTTAAPPPVAPVTTAAPPPVAPVTTAAPPPVTPAPPVAPVTTAAPPPVTPAPPVTPVTTAAPPPVTPAPPVTPVTTAVHVKAIDAMINSAQFGADINNWLIQLKTYDANDVINLFDELDGSHQILKNAFKNYMQSGDDDTMLNNLRNLA